MKRANFLFFCLVFIANCLNAQVYKIQDTTLSIFTINDTLKYFELDAPEYLHEYVGCGIISRQEGNIFQLEYPYGSSYNKFKIVFTDKTVGIIRTSEDGFIPYNLERNSNRFIITKATPQQKVSKFYPNYPIHYIAKNNLAIKVYEYPCFEAKITQVYFKKGSKIEEKWGVGHYIKFKPIKNKFWIASVYGKKFIGWLLLSDLEDNFTRVKEED